MSISQYVRVLIETLDSERLTGVMVGVSCEMGKWVKHTDQFKYGRRTEDKREGRVVGALTKPNHM